VLQSKSEDSNEKLLCLKILIQNVVAFSVLFF
jgi:hypothetical protein